MEQVTRQTSSDEIFLLVVDHRGRGHALPAIDGWRATRLSSDWGIDLKGTAAATALAPAVDGEAATVPASPEKPQALVARAAALDRAKARKGAAYTPRRRIDRPAGASPAHWILFPSRGYIGRAIMYGAAYE